MPTIQKTYQIMLGTFIEDKFVWHEIEGYDDMEPAYKAFKAYVNTQLKYTDEELKKVWKTGRLDIELRQGTKLLNWVGVYARAALKDTDDDEKAKKEKPAEPKKDAGKTKKDSLSNWEEVNIKTKVKDIKEIWVNAPASEGGSGYVEYYDNDDCNEAFERGVEYSLIMFKGGDWSHSIPPYDPDIEGGDACCEEWHKGFSSTRFCLDCYKKYFPDDVTKETLGYFADESKDGQCYCCGKSGKVAPTWVMGFELD